MKHGTWAIALICVVGCGDPRRSNSSIVMEELEVGPGCDGNLETDFRFATCAPNRTDFSFTGQSLVYTPGGNGTIDENGAPAIILGDPGEFTWDIQLGLTFVCVYKIECSAFGPWTLVSGGPTEAEQPNVTLAPSCNDVSFSTTMETTEGFLIKDPGEVNALIAGNWQQFCAGRLTGALSDKVMGALRPGCEAKKDDEARQLTPWALNICVPPEDGP